MIAAACVEDLPSAVPPTDPSIGNSYIVGQGANGAWTGRSRCLACFTSGGWRFLEPREGMIATVRTEKTIASFRDGLWSVGDLAAARVLIGGKQVVGAQRPAVPSPTGGTSVDSECRDALSQLLTALRQHGLIAS